MRVLVLMGGTSAEREVSLRSGAAVVKALQNIGHQAEGLDFNSHAINAIRAYAPDVVFIALHGKPGEDGTVQGLLDLLKIPYTGSGLATSAICIDKVLTKKYLSGEGIPTAPYEIISQSGSQQDTGRIGSYLADKLGMPLVVKPSTQGSSIGTLIVKDPSQIGLALEQAFLYDREVLVEQYIAGAEVTVAMLGNDEIEVLPIIEITSVNEFYDFDSKYTQGKCEHIIPARISPDVKQEIEQIAVQTYKLLGCRGFARVDFRIDKSGKPFVLEVNTIPGMTEMSLVPDAAKAAGISFNELVERIVRLAQQN
ncbi:MAG: D-alanine--D-alanine ligase [Syntrophomonadaceae bacterium]|jgi:D-alanine-D-alanine ligase|nr:D-alanine--D-alanine ligase [Bacillota bacterium]NLP24948.1 D-alanine--D-alanine ligase [Syntrophomonadaceae bacterium]